MATRRPAGETVSIPRNNIVVAAKATALTRPFLPSLDLVATRAAALKELSSRDKRQILATKIADVTHFQAGLATLHQHAALALDLVAEVRTLPKAVRGRILQPDRTSAERVSVQPTMAGGIVLGRGVVTDELGVFTLPLPEVSDARRKALLDEGLGLRITGRDGVLNVVVPVPAQGAVALGEIVLNTRLLPLPQSVIAALIDLVDDLPAATPGKPGAGHSHTPIRVELGQDVCNITFEEDTIVRRFPYKMLVRLVEPRTTTVNEVFVPSGPFFEGSSRFLAPIWDPALVQALELKDTRFVERVPVDKPVSVDGFRDQVIGVQGSVITGERRIPMAGTLGLGYVLNLAQVWKYEGLTLGNLLYSLPLAPGEQQRIAVSERVATASVTDREVVEVAERQHSSLREDASTQAVFESAFEEHVAANSSYRNEARSSSWGVGGGIGGFFGGLLFGVGAGGGGGKSSNSGSTQSALDGARNYASTASETMHRSVEREASARRRSQRTAIRLATETDRETVTTKVITNHNKAHALTLQYWEVLRKFAATTEVEGVNLVCFVPLDLVRFLPEGQPLELNTTLNVDTRPELLTRYSLIHRHADAIQPLLPGRHQEGIRLLEDFAANPRATLDIAGPAADTLSFSLKGTFLPYEKVWVSVLFRNGRRLGRIALDSPLTVIDQREFGSRAELIEELRKRRQPVSGDTLMTGSIAIPESLDRSDIIGFELTRAFETIDYQFDFNKFLVPPPAGFEAFFGTLISGFQPSVRITPAQLEREIGGPQISEFSAKLNNAVNSLALSTFTASSRQELPPTPMPIAAVETNPALNFRDLMKIERMTQHVVRNTLTYSKAVWSSLTAEERVVMLEGYTIGLPEEGLDAAGFTDPSQHVPLLNCVANQVLGYYGNCMVMPFSIPASLAAKLAGPADADGTQRPPLTSSAVQDALTQFHKAAFSPPVSNFTLPTRGVLGEAVLGHCPSAEKIDLTRFWNWQDSPADSATEITGVALRPNTVAQLAAPSTLSNVPSIINNVAGEGSTSTLGTLAKALSDKGPQATDFSSDFLGQELLKTLGAETIKSAEAARADALAKATDLAKQALTAAPTALKAVQEGKAARDEKKAAEAKGLSEKQAAAVTDLKENAASYLAVAAEKGNKADNFAEDVIESLTGEKKLPANLAAKLFEVFDKKDGGGVRTAASTAWLKALGLI